MPMSLPRFCTPFVILLTMALCSPQPGAAQTPSGNQPWSASSQQNSPNGNINPTRTMSSHTETGDRTSDSTSVERIGPDGRYIPYSDTEAETVRINETTSRTIE